MTGAASPLTPGQQAELLAAQERAASFSGASKVAVFNGWSVGIFAALSILSGIFSLTGLLVGIGLAVVARNEFVGARRLRALDTTGLELLWRNQVGFLTLIVGYCLWSIYATIAHPDASMTELTDLLGEGTGELVRSLTLTVYAAVIAATVLFQGLNARYYFIRVARLEEYLRETPGWIVDLFRSTSPG